MHIEVFGVFVGQVEGINLSGDNKRGMEWEGICCGLWPLPFGYYGHRDE
jgi:hypothetical protein